MSLKLPNLDRIIKEDPPLGEALQRIESYEKQNIVAIPGNVINPPPASTTPGASTSTPATTTPIAQPPTKITPNPPSDAGGRIINQS